MEGEGDEGGMINGDRERERKKRFGGGRGRIIKNK